MATTMTPPGPTSMPQQHHQLPQPPHPPQGLPSISSLTNGLPPSAYSSSPDPTSATDSTRDSGTWPGSQSKHTSANSGLQVHTLLNPDDSPSRISAPGTPLSARLPHSAQAVGGSILPSINQGFHEPPSNRESRDSNALSLDSRRSSIDSRMHHGMQGLYIHGKNQQPTSPYESANASQVSLAASLRHPNGQGPLSPLSARNSLTRSQPRVAPPIIGRIAGAPDPTAARPTQGFAWAFPDSAIPEERRGSDDSGDSSGGKSRQNSFVGAASVHSSIFSNDSHLPVGQRRLNDDHQTTHHHTMQHRTVQSLQNEHSAQGVGSYSRTPELRVSHKLAERKRRSEMKDLFEELNRAVPSNGGSKASKWEILTKAIDYILQSQHAERQVHAEVQRLQRDADYARDAHKENEMLRTEVQVMHQHLRRLDPGAPHVYGHYTAQLNTQQPGPPPPAPPPSINGGGAAATNGAPISLPPLQTAAVPPPPPAPQSGAMQGVEYGGFGR